MNQLALDGIIKTVKKQRVYYLDKVPHDLLLLSAIHRDQKRVTANQPTTTTNSPTLANLVIDLSSSSVISRELFDQRPYISVTATPSLTSIPHATKQASPRTSTPQPTNKTYHNLTHRSTTTTDTIPYKKTTKLRGVPARVCYQCEVSSCLRSFGRAEHLKRHLLTHQNNKPHRCHHCHKLFTRKDNLQAHVSVIIERPTSQVYPRPELTTSPPLSSFALT